MPKQNYQGKEVKSLYTWPYFHSLSFFLKETFSRQIPRVQMFLGKFFLWFSIKTVGQSSFPVNFSRSLSLPIFLKNLFLGFFDHYPRILALEKQVNSSSGKVEAMAPPIKRRNMIFFYSENHDPGPLNTGDDD